MMIILNDLRDPNTLLLSILCLVLGKIRCQTKTKLLEHRDIQ